MGGGEKVPEAQVSAVSGTQQRSLGQPSVSTTLASRNGVLPVPKVSSGFQDDPNIYHHKFSCYIH